MFCFNVWAAAQIILESFPISSSGHSILISFWCPLERYMLLSASLFSYIEYALHVPTAVIVSLFFIRDWSFPFMHIARCWKLIFKISTLTALSSSITIVGYAGVTFLMRILLDQFALDQHVLNSSMFILTIGFSITALSLFSLRWCSSGNARWDIQTAAVLGIVQTFAFIPGISRFGTTYVAARWMHISARRAFEISFLIQWPLIVCASMYSCFILRASSIELLNLPFVWVMLGASMMAYIGLCIVSHMVKKKMMWWWSIYMLLPITMSLIIGVLHA